MTTLSPARPPGPSGQPGPVRGGTGTTKVLPLLAKVLGIGIVASLAILITPPLISQQRWGFFAVIWGVVLLLLAVYVTKRAVPAKYLLPGSLFLALMVVFPILMTFQLSTTNFGDGTRTSKESTIAKIMASSAFQAEGARRFALAVGTEGDVATGPFTFFLVDQASGDTFAGSEDGLADLPDDAVVTDGAVTEVPGFTLLTRQQINDLSTAGAPLDGFAVPTGERTVITALGFSAVELTSPLLYDEDADTFTDTRTGVTYSPVRSGDRSYYTDAEGNRLSTQSWGESVGFANYQRIFTDTRISQNFLGIFVWTVVFAVLSVGLSFALGL
ncbi:MAG TPA: sugar ABC transporter permease, partial [Actinotalea sp.]|nr:sugar ABC transporter permease [Actinotalea sp.]